MSASASRARAAFVLVGAVVAPLFLQSACAPGAAPRVAEGASFGATLYGAMCDRVGAQSLPEDIMGLSYQAVCHADAAGAYATHVDQKPLVPVGPGGAQLALGEATLYGITRVEALARHRTALVAALDTTLPDVESSDATGTCGVDPKRPHLHAQLEDFVRRLLPLAGDGTLPESTATLAELLRATAASPAANASLAALGARRDYRAPLANVGAAKALLGYPRLRPLTNAALRLVGPDADPYGPARVDAHGRYVPTLGVAHDRFAKLLEVGHAEALTWTPEPPRSPYIDELERARPRTALELLATIAELPAPVSEHMGLGDARLALRDERGVARVVLQHGVIPAPFVDADHDGRADLDARGAFMTTNGAPAPAPFPVADPPLYAYVDAAQSFGGALVRDTHALLAQDDAAHDDTLIAALDGLEQLLGPRAGRDGSVKHYAPQSGPAIDVKYNGFVPGRAPLLDVVYAAGQVAGDASTEDTLALVRTLSAEHPAELARLVGALLGTKKIVDRYDAVAPLAKDSPFADEVLDVLVDIAHEPDLLEDVLRASAEDQTAALGSVAATYLTHKDRVTYDHNNLNAPPVDADSGRVEDLHVLVDRAAADSGANRSAFQRLLALLNDSDGVALCNKKDAVVYGYAYLQGVAQASRLPLSGTYRECEFLKVDNLGAFFIDSIVGQAELRFRVGDVAQGSDVSLLERGSGIQGFWDPPGSHVFHPKPQFLSRQAFFDFASDSPHEGDKNWITRSFIQNLNGLHVGAAECPERLIDDPASGAFDRNPDGKVHGLRACAEGDWLDQRTGDAAFAFEKNGFYEASAPLIGAFVRHHREDAFIRLMKTAHRHWQSDRGTLRECDARDKSSVSYCARTGLSRFEPMLAEVFASDLFPALQALSRVTRGTRLGGKAGPGKDGPTVLAEALRAMIDPARAAARGLVDRAGQKTALRNDGSTNTQVTPLYLALAAYHGASDALARDASIDAAWKRTRSRIIDQLFAVNGTGVDARFASEAVRAATPLLVDTLRAELVARCRTEFAAKKSCVWATTQWTASTRDTLASPLLSSSLDVLDAMKSDAAARQELHDFLRYATDPTSPDGTLPALLTAVIDAPRVLNDETTLAPLAAALAPALTPAVLPAGEFVGNGDAAQGGFVDAQLALLARLSGRARNDDGTEACFAEVDPAGVVPVLARALVTSTPASSAAAGKTPLEVFADTLSDVNRSAPARQDGLDAADYTRLEESAVAFLTDPQRGLEQLYQILWNVSKGHTSETSSPGTGLTTR